MVNQPLIEKKKGEVKEGKTYIDGIEATALDPCIVPESAAIPPETLKMAENFRSKGFNVKVDILENITFLPKSSPVSEVQTYDQGATPKKSKP